MSVVFLLLAVGSLSARRAWIEICGGVSARLLVAWSLSARRAWIEITSEVSDRVPLASLSARRAWIEIPWLDAEY